MPRGPSDAIPGLQHDRASGQASVLLNGHQVCLGRSTHPDLKKRYDDTIKAWLANDRRWPPPAPLPPVLRRYEVWVAAVFVSSVLSAVAAPFVLRRVAPWLSPLWALPGIPLAIVTTTFGTIWYSRRRTDRIKRAVRAAAGRACVGCVYDLSGMGDTGACPECGRRFDIAADQRSWERARML